MLALAALVEHPPPARMAVQAGQVFLIDFRLLEVLAVLKVHNLGLAEALGVLEARLPVVLAEHRLTHTAAMVVAVVAVVALVVLWVTGVTAAIARVMVVKLLVAVAVAATVGELLALKAVPVDLQLAVLAEITQAAWGEEPAPAVLEILAPEVVAVAVADTVAAP